MISEEEEKGLLRESRNSNYERIRNLKKHFRCQGQFPKDFIEIKKKQVKWVILKHKIAGEKPV